MGGGRDKGGEQPERDKQLEKRGAVKKNRGKKAGSTGEEGKKKNLLFRPEGKKGLLPRDKVKLSETEGLPWCGGSGRRD